MTATLDSKETTLTGITEIIVATDPGSGNQFELLMAHAWNKDTTVKVITFNKVGGDVTPYEVAVLTMEPGSHANVVLAGLVLKNGQTLKAIVDANAASFEPIVSVSWFKIP